MNQDNFNFILSRISKSFPAGVTVELRRQNAAVPDMCFGFCVIIFLGFVEGKQRPR